MSAQGFAVCSRPGQAWRRLIAIDGAAGMAKVAVAFQQRTADQMTKALIEILSNSDDALVLVNPGQIETVRPLPANSGGAFCEIIFASGRRMIAEGGFKELSARLNGEPG